MEKGQQEMLERLLTDPLGVKREMDAKFAEVKAAVEQMEKPVEGSMMMAFFLYLACAQGVFEGFPPGLVHATFDMAWQRAEKDRKEILSLGRGPLDGAKAIPDA